MSKINFLSEDDDNEIISFSFETIQRSYMIERFVDFMRASGWGMPEDIEIEINDMIADKFDKKYELTEEL